MRSHSCGAVPVRSWRAAAGRANMRRPSDRLPTEYHVNPGATRHGHTDAPAVSGKHA